MTPSHCLKTQFNPEAQQGFFELHKIKDRPSLIACLADYYDELYLDNDGTVARTENLHAQVGAELMTKCGVPTSFEERFLMMGMGEGAIWDAQRIKGMPLNIGRNEFINEHQRLFLEALGTLQNPAALVREGVVDLVDAFRNQRKTVAVASNTPRSVVEQVQKIVGLWDKMDLVVTYDDIAKLNLKPKPAPDVYNLAKSRAAYYRNSASSFSAKMKESISHRGLDYETTPEECIITNLHSASKNYLNQQADENVKALAVEDTSKGISSALGAGCDVIGIYYDTAGHTPDPRAFISTPDSQLFLAMK